MSPVIRDRFEKDPQTVLDDLKIYAETGKISANKQKALHG